VRREGSLEIAPCGFQASSHSLTTVMALAWTTISALATAGGTLVLAIATFASVRSANYAARTAERAFQVGLRPVLFPSRLEDNEQRVRWVDDHWATISGGKATMEEADGSIYMAMSLRNVGAGIAVLHSWRAEPLDIDRARVPPRLEEFHAQSRDLYVPQGEISFWQAAIRDTEDPSWQELRDAIHSGQSIVIDLLYSDHEGGQRAISRFTAIPPEEAQREWLSTVVRHWNLDRADPR